jgi:class 3 adenylate cyclase
MTERPDIVQRRLAAIFIADVVGYSRLTGADEERILARLRTLRSDLVDPTVAVHQGRIVKGTGDGVLAEFRSVVEAVRCAIEVQRGLAERNAGLPLERRIQFRIGIHLGDIVEEPDGDIMGDGVNIAARLEGIAKPGAISLSEDAYRQVKARLEIAALDQGLMRLKNIADPMRVYSLNPERLVENRTAGPKKRRHLTSALARIAALSVLVGAIGWYLSSQIKTQTDRPMASTPTVIEPGGPSKSETEPPRERPAAPPQKAELRQSTPAPASPASPSIMRPPSHAAAPSKPAQTPAEPQYPSARSPSADGEGAPDKAIICDDRNWIAGGTPAGDPSGQRSFFVCSKP